jgi:hypothetical protein
MQFMQSRRSFLSGLGSMLAAPAIVHAGNLMPVRAVPVVGLWDPIEGMKSQVHSGVLTIDHIRRIVEAIRNQPQWPIYEGNYVLPVHPKMIPLETAC